MIKVALASYGMSGEVFHAPLLSVHPQFSLYKVLERNHEKSKAKYPDVTVVRQYEDILSDKAVDLVVVNTPNTLHFDMCKAALEAGKHVVVEKPFVVHAEQADILIKLAKKKRKVLTVFQNRRFDSDFMTIQQLLSQQLLGFVVEFEAHYDRYRNYIEENTWKEASGPGSGILYNLGSHMIDQALVLFGMPRSIQATLGVQRKGGAAIDSYHLLMQYPHLQVILKAGYLVRDPGPRYKIHGNAGSFTKYGLDVQEDALKAGQRPGTARWGEEPEALWGTLDTDMGGLHYRGQVASLPGDYTLFYKNLYEVLTGNAKLLVRPEEALQGIRLIELAIQSHKENRCMTVS